MFMQLSGRMALKLNGKVVILMLRVRIGKQRQCKKATATGVNKLNSFSGSQLWRLNYKKMQNKKELWIVDDEWNFKTKDDLVYIENISQKKVLGATNNGNGTKRGE